MNKLINILQTPFFIALVIVAIIIPFLPRIFDKYKMELIDSETGLVSLDGEKSWSTILYNDLDNDGKSEKIKCVYRSPKHHVRYDEFVLYDNEDGVICQLNFSTRLHPGSRESFGDCDNNGFNEIYFFPFRNDSVFIQCFIDPYTGDGCERELTKPKYVDKIRKNSANDIGWFSDVKYYDLNGDGFKELIFSIYTGFATQPRNLYVYDVANDTILKSPKSGSTVSPLLYDINDDGKLEIISGSIATGNLPSDFPYSDNSAWFFVLDNKLNFLFKPVEFPLFQSNTLVVPYRIKDKTFIAVLYYYNGTENIKSALYLYNAKGEKVKEKILPDEYNKKGFGGLNLITLNSQERDRLYLIDKNGNILWLDENFETIDEYKFQHISVHPSVIDVDGDGEQELFFLSEDQQKVTILRNDFSDPITADVPNRGGNLTLQIKQNGKSTPHISLQMGETRYMFSYLSNPLYYLKYLIYVGIWMGLSLLVFGIQKIGAYKLEQDKKQLEYAVMERTSQIQKQKDEIAAQKEIIEEKNKNLIDSMQYAKRIQSAILPPLKQVKEYLPDNFIFYKPKDIVSGDFYWVEHKDGKVLFAACDCTGHGVPGAMVSVICVNGLNRSVREHGITDPGKILYKTREIVIAEFAKSEEEVKDGMDIALCALQGNTLQYAGAHNPLWIVRKKSTEKIHKLNAGGIKKTFQLETCDFELYEIKADKQPIGKFYNPQPYSTHTVELQKGDTIYIFSDGYVDQFGGDKGKKFKAKSFRELLLSIQEKPMDEQKTIIDKIFEEWKGNLEQIDDVCVIGVRV